MKNNDVIEKSDLFENLISGLLLSKDIRANYDFLLSTIRNNKNWKIIIDYVLDKYEKYNLLFCFNLIYDLDEFKDKTIYFLEQKNCKVTLTTDTLINFMKNTSFGKRYVLDNLEYIVTNCSSNMETIIDYIYTYNDIEFLNEIKEYPDLHIRYIFINCLLENYHDKLNIIYPDLTSYLSIKDNDKCKLMDISDISKLAVNAFYYNDLELYQELKDYIFKNYKSNDIGENFINLISDKKCSCEDRIYTEFIDDIDNLFRTSARYKLVIYKRYSRNISLEFLNEFKKYLDTFKINDKVDRNLEKIFYFRLWDELTEYFDKYLDLSNDKTCNYVASGFGTSVYRVGDYVLKLSKVKHSTSDVICPNLYLILKNLEEHYILGRYRTFYAGIEVQQYLKKDARSVPDYIFKLYEREMKSLGYYVDDKLIRGMYGDNCMLLDSYMDADCTNHKNLPDWFKEYPVVLVDRDLVYRIDNSCKNKKIKCYK